MHLLKREVSFAYMLVYQVWTNQSFFMTINELRDNEGFWNYISEKLSQQISDKKSDMGDLEYINKNSADLCSLYLIQGCCFKLLTLEM